MSILKLAEMTEIAIDVNNVFQRSGGVTLLYAGDPDNQCVFTGACTTLPSPMYVVGIRGAGMQLPGFLANEGMIAVAVRQYLAKGYEHVGVWRDPETDIVYVDALALYDDLSDALITAARTGEKAVFGAHDGQVYYVTSTGRLR